MLEEINHTALCPCSSGLNYQNCCSPYHQNKINPPNAEALMRSRFSAYALHLIDYLLATTHPSVRHKYKKEEIKSWATINLWLKLEICEASETVVEFKAYFEHKKQFHIHHERSLFKKENNKWYYLAGEHFN